MSEPRAVDSEGVITFREIQSDGNNDQSYDHIGNDSSNGVPPVVSNHLKSETSMTECSRSMREPDCAQHYLVK
jgi:hypothetical protein